VVFRQFSQASRAPHWGPTSNGKASGRGISFPGFSASCMMHTVHFGRYMRDLQHRRKKNWFNCEHKKKKKKKKKRLPKFVLRKQGRQLKQKMRERVKEDSFRHNVDAAHDVNLLLVKKKTFYKAPKGTSNQIEKKKENNCKAQTAILQTMESRAPPWLFPLSQAPFQLFYDFNQCFEPRSLSAR